MFYPPREVPTHLCKTDSFDLYLNYYMRRVGLSENKLSAFSRLNQPTLNKIVNGRMKNVSIPMLVCICLALGLNEAESVDLLSRRERAFSPADDTHRVYRELIRIYSMKEIDYKRTDPEMLLKDADEYLKHAKKPHLPNAPDEDEE